ncbi:hypothetical protein [Streptomyces sp. NPDC002738]
MWEIELATLVNLAAALCGQGRYEEAGAIARGDLPRADADTAPVLQRVLVSEKALAEARRLMPDRVRAASEARDIGAATALYSPDRRSEAEATARQALNACEQFLHPIHPRTQEARTLLGCITAEDPLA